MMDALGRLLVGTVSTTDSWVREYSNIDSSSVMSTNLAYSQELAGHYGALENEVRPSVGASLVIGNLLDLTEELFLNITLSLLSRTAFLQTEGIQASNVTIYTPVNVYFYS